MSYVQQAREVLLAKYPDEDRPERLIDLYTLLVLTRGERCTMEDVHDAWGIWTAADRPEHDSLVPFGDLTPEIQAYDRPYLDAIQQAAAELKERA